MSAQKLKIFLSLAAISFLIFGLSNNLCSQTGWPRAVSIAGANIGSTGYVFSGAWAKILSDTLKVNVRVEVTTGPSANVLLTHKNDTDFGDTSMLVASEGYSGTGWAQGKKQSNIRIIFPQAAAYLHWWVLAKYPIYTIHDMKGYDINLSGAGSTPDVVGRRLFEFFNIKPNRIINGGFGDANDLMRDGLLPAIANFGGIPHPSIAEIAITHEIRIVGVSKSDGEKFIAKNPGLSLGTIPARTYKWQDKPVDSLSMWRAMICNKDLPEDFIYAVLRETFQNRDALIAAIKASEDIIPENIKYVFNDLPLHAGAVRYYREKGISIPDVAIPPEYKKRP